MLVRLLCTFLVLVFAICTGVDRSFADTRVALVIGNGAYQNAPRLPNPTNDAAGVAAALKRAGFDTILATDLSKAGMDEATIRFARAARTADVAMFYYSGHALQFAGVNYLAPVDIDLRDETDLRRMTRVDDVVADLAKARNLRILVLDSCRDNPLAEQLKRSIGASRALPLQRGLAKIDSPEGMIVAYATQAGRTADDGDGKNSPYTTAFLKHIDEKEEIGSIFRRISADVYETTKHEQLPELSLSLIGEFYLHGKVEVTIKPEDTTLRDFDAAAAVDTVTGWDAFLKQHPEGFYATLAQERRAKAAAKISALPADQSSAAASKERPQVAVTPSNVPPVVVSPQEQAERAWAMTKDTTSQAVLEDFIRRFGDSYYATLARARMEELKKSQTVVVAPPVTLPSPLAQVTLELEPQHQRTFKPTKDLEPEDIVRLDIKPGNKPERIRLHLCGPACATASAVQVWEVQSFARADTITYRINQPGKYYFWVQGTANDAATPMHSERIGDTLMLKYPSGLEIRASITKP
jgi:hypothetical protein